MLRPFPTTIERKRELHAAILREGGRQCAIAFELVSGWIDASLELVDPEPMPGFQRLRMLDELVRRAHFTESRIRVVVAKEEVACELHRLAELAAQERVHWHAQFFPHDVEAGELDRGMQCVRLL